MNVRTDYEQVFDKARRLYESRAQKISLCDKKIRLLLDRVSLRLKEFSATPLVMEARFQLEVFIRMLTAHIQKRYRSLSPRSLALLVLGLFYFALPLDLVPDFIPFVGYVDDLSVLLAVYKSIHVDIERFLEWERSQAKTE
ncbi:YkvA family protein [Pleomorphovibrio marinus]|uniref:YkvA family protein n=1 Tax=Pleomorphovibrio marinus TaxID=2164132 RepID=UPI000E0B6E9F|nr:YkvA family protein [Pleomorphovibrio marinus]